MVRHGVPVRIVQENVSARAAASKIPSGVLRGPRFAWRGNVTLKGGICLCDGVGDRFLGGSFSCAKASRPGRREYK